MFVCLFVKQQSIAIKSIRYDPGKKLACRPSETMKFFKYWPGETRPNYKKDATSI
jgi:hypothetical protein